MRMKNKNMDPAMESISISDPSRSNCKMETPSTQEANDEEKIIIVEDLSIPNDAKTVKTTDSFEIQETIVSDEIHEGSESVQKDQSGLAQPDQPNVVSISGDLYEVQAGIQQTVDTDMENDTGNSIPVDNIENSIKSEQLRKSVSNARLEEILQIRSFDLGADSAVFSRYEESMLVLPDTFYAEVSSKNGMMFYLDIFAAGKNECVIKDVLVESAKWKKRSAKPVVCVSEMPLAVATGKHTHLAFECHPEEGLLGKQNIKITCVYNGKLEDEVEGTLEWIVSESLFSWTITPALISLPEVRKYRHSITLRKNEFEASPVLYESRVGEIIPSEHVAIFPKKVIENSESGRSLLNFEIPENIEAIGWSRIFVSDSEDEQGQYQSVSISSADPSGIAQEAWIMPGADGPKLLAPVSGSGNRIIGMGELNLYAVKDATVSLKIRCETRYMKLMCDSCSISPGKTAHIRFSVLETAMSLPEARDLKLWVHDGLNEILIPVPLQREASTIRILEGMKVIASPYVPIGEKLPLTLMVPTTGPGEMDIEIGCDLFRYRWPRQIVGKGGGNIEWHSLDCEMDTSLMHPVDRIRFIVTAISNSGEFYERTVVLDSTIVGLDFSIEEPQAYGRSHLLRFVKNPELQNLGHADEFIIKLKREDSLPGSEIVWELLDGEGKTPAESIEEIRVATGVRITREKGSETRWHLVHETSSVCEAVRTVIIKAISKATGTGPELVTSFSLLLPATLPVKDQI